MNNTQRHYKGIISVAILLLLAHIAFGQSYHAGFFGGVTASQVDGDVYSGYNKVGLTAGGFYNRFIDIDFYGQIELKYVQRGVFEGPEANDRALFRSTYHYLELPLSVHYLHNEKIQVEMGFSPEILLGVVYRDEFGVMDPLNFPENRMFGMSVFAGLCYWFKPTVGVLMRYTHSAIPFREREEWNNPQYRGFFHSVFSLSLAYRIWHE